MICQCRQCLRDRNEGITLDFGRGQSFFWPEETRRMVVCAKCGNKRCPHANDHRNECTGSNDRGQPGSAYP